MKAIAANVGAWIRERFLWVVVALLFIVAGLSWALRREHLNRMAAEALAKWERAVNDSAARRRVRVEAAEARRDVLRASSLRERVLALQRADDRRDAIYSAGGELGLLFDRTFKAGRR
jgi:hypothetical protein